MRLDLQEGLVTLDRPGLEPLELQVPPDLLVRLGIREVQARQGLREALDRLAFKGPQALPAAMARLAAQALQVLLDPQGRVDPQAAQDLLDRQGPQDRPALLALLGQMEKLAQQVQRDRQE